MEKSGSGQTPFVRELDSIALVWSLTPLCRFRVPPNLAQMKAHSWSAEKFMRYSTNLLGVKRILRG